MKWDYIRILALRALIYVNVFVIAMISGCISLRVTRKIYQ